MRCMTASPSSRVCPYRALTETSIYTLFTLSILGLNMPDSGRKRWKKILYEDQGVPDNYVDESFLDEMKKNCA